MSGNSDQNISFRNHHVSSIELSLMDSLAQCNLRALVTDVSEIGLDALTDDNLVKSIPVFGTLIKLHDGIVTIRDRMFMKKVLGFLLPLADVEASECDKFLDELARDVGSRTKAGYAMVLLLERLDDLHKPEYVGRVYRARLEGRITMEQMHRLCFIVDLNRPGFAGDSIS